MSENKCQYENCVKKVGLIHIICRCNKAFCIKHRMPEVHICTYDYKTIGKEQLKKENTTIKFDKIVKI